MCVKPRALMFLVFFTDVLNRKLRFSDPLVSESLKVLKSLRKYKY